MSESSPCAIVLILCCYPQTTWNTGTETSKATGSTAGSTTGSSPPNGEHIDVEAPKQDGDCLKLVEEPEADNVSEWDADVQEQEEPPSHFSHLAPCAPEEKCPAAMLGISEDASVMEGLRCLLVHHLHRSSVVALSASQAQLLEHHLERIAVYSQKIVHTITFAQRVLDFQENQTSDRIAEAEEEDEESESAPQRTESESSRRKPKRLVLQDKELLEMYSLAQHEAQLEADWRGCGSDCSFNSAADQEEERSRSREHEAAIGLLGQALAARQGLVAGQQKDMRSLSASEDLARRLIPARQVRHCGDVVSGPESLPGIACCVPQSTGSGEALAERPPATPTLAVTPAEARAWLHEARAGAWSAKPG